MRFTYIVDNVNLFKNVFESIQTNKKKTVKGVLHKEVGIIQKCCFLMFPLSKIYEI